MPEDKTHNRDCECDKCMEESEERYYKQKYSEQPCGGCGWCGDCDELFKERTS